MAHVGQIDTLRGVLDLSEQLAELKLNSGASIRAAVGIEQPLGFLPLCVATLLDSGVASPTVDEAASAKRARQRAIEALTESVLKA